MNTRITVLAQRAAVSQGSHVEFTVSDKRQPSCQFLLYETPGDQIHHLSSR